MKKEMWSRKWEKRAMKYTVTAATVAAVLVFSGCVRAEAEADNTEAEEIAAYETGTLLMGTGEAYSQVYDACIGVGTVINNTVPGIHVRLETTKGDLINARNLSEGDFDLALISGDVAYDAYYGENSFEGTELNNLRAIGACYQEVSGWMALKKSGMTHVNELKGKIISSGSKASATEVASEVVFEVLGIDLSNTEIYTDSLLNSVQHIKRETADAVHAFTAVPYSAHKELADEMETVVLSYTEEELDQIIDADSRYFRTEIPAGTYNGQEDDVSTFGIKVLVCVNEDMDEDLAYEIARAMDLNGPVHTSSYDFMTKIQDKNFLCKELPIPLHEGAEKYYREVGFLGE